MESFFDDFELNQNANLIINYVEKTASPISNGGMMSSFNENGLKIARSLLEFCQPKLNFIKKRVGKYNENYLQLSDTVAVFTSAIIKMPISEISLFANTNEFHSNYEAVRLSKLKLADATNLMSIISNFDMSSRARNTINQNLGILNEAEKRVNGKNGGCYIATYVYGSYNSKEVMIIRSFRDNMLAVSLIGRIIIKLYYRISPLLIKHFGEYTKFKILLKFLLDKLVSKLSFKELNKS